MLKDNYDLIKHYEQGIKDENERIIKLLKECRNLMMAKGDIAHAQMLHTAVAIINGDITFIRGETNEVS